VQFQIQVCFLVMVSSSHPVMSRVSIAEKEHFSFRDCKPTTLTFEPDLEKVKLNQRAKYLGQKSFHSKVIGHTIVQTHTLQTHIQSSALPGLRKWSVTKT